MKPGRAFLGSLAGAFLLAGLCGAAAAQPGANARPLYTIAIGQNRALPALAGKTAALETLRYADDDAVRIYSLLESASRQAFLLTVPDADTQVRFPDTARVAVPPTEAELERTLDIVNGAMQSDRAAGREPVLFFFFSGHGVVAANGDAALALFDGALTRRFLEQKVLARLPARYVHLIIDACHAGAVVRSRDANAKLEPLAPPEVERYLADSTLNRFPHAGAILASTASTQSFEWDIYRGGVFAHELLSGLRGAADVNGDGRIEYSELAAFLSAANLHVADPRARLDIVAQAPRSDARVALLDHSVASAEFKLVGRAEGPWTKAFYIESENGNRLLDVFPEKGTSLKLWLPAGRRLYLVRGDQEAQLSASPGREIALASLSMQAVRKRSRDALESSLREGLFGMRYGPSFYLGFTSQREGLVPVPLTGESSERDDSPATERTPRPASTPSGLRPVGAALLVTSGAAAVAAGVFTGLALGARAEYESADYEGPASDAVDRYNSYRTLAWVSGGAAVAAGALGLTLFLWPRTASPRTVGVSLDTLRVGNRGLTLSGKF